ncbi:FHA domain-containing protein [Arthrobacter sp. CDRTa11]|uniref:FtsK/SpoIIIE domain-containing protein n=1 Tax=Arthrobacter sp. CDRTa11 TaxID=2651199 RepID=UPI0022658135|nr:FtsK/SpoIIIE domain-containing protein [Arthrobacter sp. CDRTa11]UZX03904.1 FHA domain-containing protein [Arthrobacter sp. CDRTa11]
MRFHCTLAGSPGSVLHGPPHELTIEAPAGTNGAELEARIADRFGTGRLLVEGESIRPMMLGKPPLVHGAVLVDKPAGSPALRPRRPRFEPPPSLALAVHSGAGAGTVVPLQRGTYTIGRGNADIPIPDPELSREHARLVVTETVITIVDLDSVNGTEVDGERIRNAAITTDSMIHCGNSTMSLIVLAQPGPGLGEAGASVEEPLVVSHRVEATNRAALLVTAVLPLAIGVGLAVVTGMWIFLAFTALSAVSIVVPVFSGRRQRRALAAAVTAAVREDKDRRRRSAPPLSVLVIATHHSDQGSVPPAVPADPVWLRLGLAVQPANLRFEPADPDKAIPTAGLVPLTLDPARLLSTVRGSRLAVDGLLRSALMQLAGYSRARSSRILVHGAAGCLPLSARYLPAVTLCSSTSAVTTLLENGWGPAYSHGVLILTGAADAAETLTGIVAKAAQFNWQVIHFSFGDSPPVVADVDLHEEGTPHRTEAGHIAFLPDLAPMRVFDHFCRELAVTVARPGKDAKTVPPTCLLAELIPSSPPETSSRWATGRRTRGLVVPLGRSAEGSRLLDLQADGPHLLVAGTTGSGKSELLRSLTLALSLTYPPDRINFLFVDFKGGSGLGPLTGLPHCVGILTDLSTHELERWLTSLRAEIRVREQMLASVQAPDLVSYATSQAGKDSPLPHLIVVIDEFRMLVDDAPNALQELMRIAAIGRSLGVHLIMATQRPQGALTADIRANVTTSIALRVQSEMESVDIINSKAAAAISVDTPGRAFLARGTEAPQEFQAASIGSGACAAEAPGITIQLASEALQATADPGFAAPDPTVLTPAQAVARHVKATTDLWRALGGHPVRRPVAAALPRVLPEYGTREQVLAEAPLPSWLQERTRRGWSINLGLMDLPNEQRIAPVIWQPAWQGHLALVGGPESGAAEALVFAVQQLMADSAESHLYVLDAGTTLSAIASHSRVGALAGLHELRRAVRILERLASEQSQRLSRASKDAETPLILVIAGWGSWASALRSGPLAWGEDLLNDLVRDGSRAGLTVILSGERELVTARFFASVPNRVYFPAGSSEESRLAWPRMPAIEMLRGRAVSFGALSAGEPAVCQFYTHSQSGSELVSEEGRPVHHPLHETPFRVEALPVMLPAHQIPRKPVMDAPSDPTPATHHPPPPASKRYRSLVIGVGGDDLAPVSVTVPAGSVFAVLGGPVSGKTNFLRLLPALNTEAGHWLAPGEGTNPVEYWSDILRKASAGEVDRGSTALVDDADLLPAGTHKELADLNALGLTVVVTARFSATLLQKVPLMFAARGVGSGLLIAPRSLLDGDLFGTRFDVEPHAPPGRAVLISDGRSMAVQLGWVPAEGSDSA